MAIRESQANAAAEPPIQGARQKKISLVARFFSTPAPIYSAATLLRAILLLYGLYQDTNTAIKYTDIDYLVFTDAARSVSRSQSPYARETYRYTPLLAWLLLPTAWRTSSQLGNTLLIAFGKFVFAVADLAAGWLIERVLVTRPGVGHGTPMDSARARMFAAIWLLNPMVATISTRGSSEGLLAVLVMMLLSAVLSRRVVLAGLLLGFGVHFKIYPFIYAPAILWWMDGERLGQRTAVRQEQTWSGRLKGFLSPARLRLTLVSLITFFGLNVVMLSLYGSPFLLHTYFHHVTRIDHRHNFSPYNVQLYLTSAAPASAGLRIESVAFLPQLLLSCVLIPLAMAKVDLPACMLAQTFAFVTFNKVCTSQYFLWYMIYLPLYLPHSSFLRNRRLGVVAMGLWVVGQALWLQQGYKLEFLGESTFVPGLWLASLAFFLVNCWVLGVIIGDTSKRARFRGARVETYQGN